jgi:hypothetical protein
MAIQPQTAPPHLPDSAVTAGPSAAVPGMRRARLRQVFEEAGFSRFRRAAETPMNLILEARP